jgi:P22 coat protein - gene protein 5.
MAINDFLTTVWSQTLHKQLNKEYIGVQNCSREFEGEIKTQGDRVKVSGIQPINVFDYTKNTDFNSTLQTLNSESQMLVIDQAAAFNFQIDDIDKAQQNPKLMQYAMKEAANALANKADLFVYSLYAGVTAGNTITKTNVKSGNIIDILLEARERLLTNNVSPNSNIVLEVSPAVGAKIAKAKILLSTNNDSELSNGYVGSLLGFDIYISNNVVLKNGADSKLYHKCFARTNRAVAFVEQVNNIEAYRPEKRFADAVKGLYLYGSKIMYASELILLDINLAATDD